MKRSLVIFILFVQIFALPAFASAEYRDTVEKSFDVTSGGTLTITSEFGAVEIKTHSSNTVDIEIERKLKASESKAKRILDDFDITFDKKGDDVFVNIDWNHTEKHCNVNLCQTIEVMVPESYNLDLNTFAGGIEVSDLDGYVNAKTVGGGISLDTISGPVDCNAVGGCVTVDNAGDDVKIETAGGAITLSRINGAIMANAAGGKITIEKANDYINATVAGGSIQATLARQTDNECRLSSTGGGITLNIAHDMNATIDAHTTIGCISTDLPLSVSSNIVSKRLKGELNDGGPLVHLRSTAGNIRINEM